MSNTNENPLATCTGRILVVKDGKDGIGIKNADVIFSVGTRKDVAPADGNDWKTTFAELILTADGYVWTCTKIMMTDESVIYSGKYCLGACSSFADIIELYALGDDNVTPPESGWKQSYTPVKGKWLWTKNELHFQNSTTVTTTKAICIGHFANDGENGTSFNLCGSAVGHYASFSAMKKKGSFAVEDVYLLDSSNDADSSANNKYNKPSVAMFLNAPDYDWYISSANIGDAYRINTDLWVCTETRWVNMGSIQGPEGDPGEDAIWVTLSPNQVTFDSDEKGMVEDDVRKYVGITVFLGSKIVTQSSQISIVSGECYDITKASVVRNNGTSFHIGISSSGISTKKITDSLTVSCPFSSITVKISYDDYVKYVTINIVVDTSVVDGYFRTGIEGLEAKYTTIKSSVDGVKNTVVAQQATITANAEQINLVAEKATITERNLNSMATTVQTWQQAGVVTRSDYAGLFSQYAENNELVARSEIATFITKDEVGNMISVAKISADNIVFDGKFFEVETSNLKVTKDGTIDSKNGTFTNVRTSGFFYKSKLEINDGNFSNYFSISREVEEFKIYECDLIKAGSWIELNLNSSNANLLTVELPAIRPNVAYTQEQLDAARRLIGNQVIIYNKGSRWATFNNTFKDGSFVSVTIEQGDFVILDCKLNADSSGKEVVCWEWKRGTAHTSE